MTRPSVSGHLGCLCVLAAVMNIGLHVSLTLSVVWTCAQEWDCGITWHSVLVFKAPPRCSPSWPPQCTLPPAVWEADPLVAAAHTWNKTKCPSGPHVAWPRLLSALAAAASFLLSLRSSRPIFLGLQHSIFPSQPFPLFIMPGRHSSPPSATHMGFLDLLLTLSLSFFEYMEYQVLT